MPIYNPDYGKPRTVKIKKKRKKKTVGEQMEAFKGDGMGRHGPKVKGRNAGDYYYGTNGSYVSRSRS